jgi:hypothetical protein
VSNFNGDIRIEQVGRAHDNTEALRWIHFHHTSKISYNNIDRL